MNYAINTMDGIKLISRSYEEIYNDRIISIMKQNRCSREEAVAELDEEERLYHEQAKQKELEMINTRLQNNGVPCDLIKASFENYQTITQSQTEALNISRTFLQNKDFLTLVFTGNHGMGKSHLGVSLLREKAGIGKYVTSKDICLEFSDVKRQFGESQLTLLKEYAAVEFLVIDEFGFTYDGSDDRPIIQGILFDRISAKKKTVLISNKDQKQTITDLGAKIIDRMKLCGKIYELKGMSFREQLAARLKKPAPAT